MISAQEDDAPPNAWTAMLGAATQPPPTAPLQALERIARAVLAGAVVGRQDAAWIAPALLAYCDPKSGAEASLEALLGLAERGRAIAAAPPPEDRRALRSRRDDQLRLIATALPGSEWRKATTLAAIVHGTGAAPTEELQDLVGNLRKEHGDSLPAAPKQYSRILKGGSGDESCGHDS
jgi:hypothetical protein